MSGRSISFGKVKWSRGGKQKARFLVTFQTNTAVETGSTICCLLTTCKMNASISLDALWWSLVLWTMSRGEYVPWFEMEIWSGNLFKWFFLSARVDLGKGAKKNKERLMYYWESNQNRNLAENWFKMVFSSGWVSPFDFLASALQQLNSCNPPRRKKSPVMSCLKS